MALEIERKFKVAGEFKSLAKSSSHICQGYLCADGVRTVRVRLRDDKGYLTIKGKSDAAGLSRFEWEKEISAEDARELLKLCHPGAIDKIRYLVDYQGHTFEVDEFYGDNEGLLMAEVELKSLDEPFERPSWLGEEVTGDRRYYNAALTRNPYKNWK